MTDPKQNTNEKEQQTGAEIQAQIETVTPDTEKDGKANDQRNNHQLTDAKVDASSTDKANDAQKANQSAEQAPKTTTQKAVEADDDAQLDIETVSP